MKIWAHEMEQVEPREFLRLLVPGSRQRDLMEIFKMANPEKAQTLDMVEVNRLLRGEATAGNVNTIDSEYALSVLRSEVTRLKDKVATLEKEKVRSVEVNKIDLERSRREVFELQDCLFASQEKVYELQKTLTALRDQVMKI